MYTSKRHVGQHLPLEATLAKLLVAMAAILLIEAAADDPDAEPCADADAKADDTLALTEFCALVTLASTMLSEAAALALLEDMALALLEDAALALLMLMALAAVGFIVLAPKEPEPSDSTCLPVVTARPPSAGP